MIPVPFGFVGRRDPLSAIPFALRLQSTRGLYQDASATQSAALAGDSVAVWRDEQTGGGLAVSQSNASKQGLYQVDSGAVALRTDGVNDEYALTISSGEYTLFVVAYVPTASSDQILASVWGADGLVGIGAYTDGTARILQLGVAWSEDSGYPVNYDLPRVYSLQQTASEIRLRINGALRGALDAAPLAGSEIYLASSKGGRFIGADYLAVLLYHGAMSDADRAATERELARLYPPTAWAGKTFVTPDGNSLTAGNTLDDPSTESYPAQLQALLGSERYTVFNDGTGGAMTENMITQAFSQVDIHYDVTLRRSIVVAWEITNDISSTNLTAEQIIAQWRSYCSARRAAGHYVIVLTVLPRIPANTLPDFEARRTPCNADLRDPANIGVFWDDVVDVAVDSRFLDYTDTEIFSDGTHLTPFGYSIVAAKVRDRIVAA